MHVKYIYKFNAVFCILYKRNVLKIYKFIGSLGIIESKWVGYYTCNPNTPKQGEPAFMNEFDYTLITGTDGHREPLRTRLIYSFIGHPHLLDIIEISGLRFSTGDSINKVDKTQ